MQDTCEQKENMKKMQEDAIKRAHEMKSRAQRFDSDERRPKSCFKFRGHLKAKNESVNLDAFDALFDDSERNLILLLILLLLEESSNSDIIIALMYLVM